jgi:hypothetical protein
MEKKKQDLNIVHPTGGIDCSVEKLLLYGVLKPIPLVLTVPEPLGVVTQITDQGTPVPSVLGQAG